MIYNVYAFFVSRWNSDQVLRTRAMPHIKTYARLSQDWQRMSWFILTSANLSKAAWGMKTKSNNLIIQSYEAGVLFLPKFMVEFKLRLIFFQIILFLFF